MSSKAESTPSSPARTSDPEKWSSSVMAGFMAQQIHTPSGGTADLAARAFSFDVGSFYSPTEGYAYPSTQRLQRLTGLSPATIRRQVKAIGALWKVDAGTFGIASKYTPTTEVLDTARNWEALRKAAVRPPTAIFYENGYNPGRAFPTPVAPVYGSSTPVLLPHTHAYWRAFAESDMTPAEKLVVAGINHSDRLVQVLGAFAHPDMASRGWSMVIASHIVPAFGWFSCTGEWLRSTYCLSHSQVTMLNAKLVESGLWVRTQDPSTRQTVWTLSDLALGQIAAHHASDRPRINTQRVVRGIAGIIAAEKEVALSTAPASLIAGKMVTAANQPHPQDEYTEFI